MRSVLVIGNLIGASAWRFDGRSLSSTAVPSRLARFKAAAVPDNQELSLGAPKTRPASGEYTTRGGVKVDVAVNGIQEPEITIERLIDALDSRRGE